MFRRPGSFQERSAYPARPRGGAPPPTWKLLDDDDYDLAGSAEHDPLRLPPVIPTDTAGSIVKNSPSGRLARLLHKTLAPWGVNGRSRRSDDVISQSGSKRKGLVDLTTLPQNSLPNTDGDNTPSTSTKSQTLSTCNCTQSICRSSCSHYSSSTTASEVTAKSGGGAAPPPAAEFVQYQHRTNRALGCSELKVLEDLFRLLGSPDRTVRERTLATIFSLARSSCALRIRILEVGGLAPILREVQRNGPANRSTARALFHLITGPVKTPFRLVQQTLSTIHRLLLTCDEAEVLVIVCYILDEITRDEPVDSPAFISQVLPSPFHSRLAELLFHESLDARYRALKLISSITFADRLHHGKDSESQFELLVWANLVRGLELGLDQPELQSIILEIVQNLMVYRLGRLIICKGLIVQYFSIIKERIGFESKLVASLSAVAQKASPEEMQFLSSCGCSDVIEKCSADMNMISEHQAQLQRLRQGLYVAPHSPN